MEEARVHTLSVIEAEEKAGNPVLEAARKMLFAEPT